MDAFILDALRTPRGAGKQAGSLHNVKPIELVSTLLRALQTRNHLDTAQVEDLILGCNTQTNEQGANLARIAALYAGWSDNVSGVTLNRFCASGLDAINYGALQVNAGMAELVAAGGVESVSRVPMFSDNGAWFTDPDVSAGTGFIHMGIAADLIATLEGFTRAELDAYAVQSHHRAARARDAGCFARSLIPVRDGAGKILLDRDELIRADTSVERVAQFEPNFAQFEAMDRIALARYPQLSSINHLHHRGNSPSLADGASLVLIGSRAKAHALGLRPRARIRAMASVGVEPILMLTGAQHAVDKVLKNADLAVQDIDLFEFYEGFASIVLKFLRDFEIDADRVNVNGGTLALGHPFGATGAMLLATLLDEMEQRNVQLGVIAASGAAGVGVATVIERV
jgi:acetyl-CoA C-acetyltransferase